MSDPAPKILTRPYYERLSELEDKHPWTQAMRRMGLELAARYAGPVPNRVLDAGCGTGRFLHECGGRWAQAQMFGCDLSADGLHFATRRGLKRLAVANVTTLPFASSAFDVVVCADVLQHLSTANANQALGQFARLLRQSGTLIIRTAARRGIGGKNIATAATISNGSRRSSEPLSRAAALMSFSSPVSTGCPQCGRTGRRSSSRRKKGMLA